MGARTVCLVVLVLVLYSWTVFGEEYPTLKACISFVPRRRQIERNGHRVGVLVLPYRPRTRKARVVY